jgi:predicted transcriptional regulator
MAPRIHQTVMCNWQAIMLLNATDEPQPVSTLANTKATGTAAAYVPALVKAGFLAEHRRRVRPSYSITEQGRLFREYLEQLEAVSA